MKHQQHALPAVSVVIPAYNAARDIGEALASVFAQTFTDFEAIVVNDGSPDGPDLLQAIAPFASRLRYIEQANRGAAAARNSGIRAARGRYVAFLDADDLWRRDFLQRQIRFLEESPRYTLVYADALITGDSDLAGRRFMETAPSQGDVTLLSLVEQRCNVLMSTVVARRGPLVDAGLFDERLRRGQDADLWLRLALAGREMAYQAIVLGERRVRRGGLSGDALSELLRAISVLDRFGRAHDLPVRERTALRVRLATLTSRTEVEHAKRRLIEGHFAAAQYHLAASAPETFRLRAAQIALRVAPALLRRAYLALRPDAMKHRAGDDRLTSQRALG